MTDEKIQAIKAVLRKRRNIVANIIVNAKEGTDVSYYIGKMDGYDQAYDLLTSCLESIKVEL